MKPPIHAAYGLLTLVDQREYANHRSAVQSGISDPFISEPTDFDVCRLAAACIVQPRT
jgi:hypothetical protein